MTTVGCFIDQKGVCCAGGEGVVVVRRGVDDGHASLAPIVPASLALCGTLTGSTAMDHSPALLAVIHNHDPLDRHRKLHHRGSESESPGSGSHLDPRPRGPSGSISEPLQWMCRSLLSPLLPECNHLRLRSPEQTRTGTGLSPPATGTSCRCAAGRLSISKISTSMIRDHSGMRPPNGKEAAVR